MVACTIIAKNYLAYARVLARSFVEHHPDGRFVVLVIDDFEGFIDPAEEPFEVFTPADIGCTPFREMALRYTVLELSTAVKPWLLRHLTGSTGRPVTYLDPDIRVFRSLERLDELASAHGVVLTPHTNEPIPPDGLTPSQVDIMVAGVWNLGYVTVAPGAATDRLLDWWSERLERDCRVDPKWGYFVDQRWFDLAPAFLRDYAIVHDPEYNVAYWNIHGRRLEHDGSVYTVNGRPLAFYHFSGFDPDHPLVLSRHQNRTDVAAHPVLAGLLAEYARDVLAAGHDRSRAWPYGFTTLGDGTPVDDLVRALHEEWLSDQPGDLDPFRADGAGAFAEWYSEQDPRAPTGVPRALATLYRGRPDVRAAFPDLHGADLQPLLRWAQLHGGRESPALARVFGARTPELGPARPPGGLLPIRHDEVKLMQTDPWGVNVVGYFRSELGTGEAARQIISALDAGGVSTLPIHGAYVPLNRQGHAFRTATPEEAIFPVNVVCMNADMLPEFARQAGEAFFAGRYSIGMWFWEVEAFPAQWHGSFALLEEVWAPTEHIARALEPVATVPVSRVRLPVHFPEPSSRSRDELGLPTDRFMFLFSFDYLSVFARKNPLAVINAFTRAFAPGDGAALVVKAINAEQDPDAHRRLCEAATQHPDVQILERYFEPADNLALSAHADAYVSLHRAEGFGLTMAEAMWHGTPVIATGYSGNLDFMTDENSLLVDHRLVPIGPDAPPYPATGQWAEPDIAHAARLMRRLFDDREAAARLGRRGATDIRRTHSPEAAAEVLTRRLELIRATGRPRRSTAARAAAAPALAALPLRVRQGPADVPGHSPARRRLRRLALRALRPFSLYQQSVNADIVRALEELNANLNDARGEQSEHLAALLRELRRLERLSELEETTHRVASRVDELEERLGVRASPLD